jgi:hypothetical protein
MFKTKTKARLPFGAAGPARLKAGPSRRRTGRPASAMPSGIEDVELFLRSGGFSG